VNLRKDHYRTSLAAVKRSLRELVFSVIVCTEKWDLSRRRRSPRGRSRIPNHASFIRVVGYLRFSPSCKKGVGGREQDRPVKRSLLRRFKESHSRRPAMHNLFP